MFVAVSLDTQERTAKLVSTQFSFILGPRQITPMLTFVVGFAFSFSFKFTSNLGFNFGTCLAWVRLQRVRVRDDGLG